jgi:hypothetical protein
MKIKTLAAAAALALSANANAAFNPGSMVLSLTASNPGLDALVSMSVDLGEQALGFERNTVAGGDLLVDGSAQEQAVVNFLSTWAGSAITYDLAGTWREDDATIGGQEREKRSGLVVSGGAVQGVVETPNVSGGIGKTNVWVSDIATVAAGDIAASFNPADGKPGGSRTPDHLLNDLVASQATTLGMELDLYSFEFYTTFVDEPLFPGSPITVTKPLLDFDVDPAGNIVLSGDGMTLAYTPVPLPAAVWMFGAAVLGIAGFARRKAS